MSTCSISLATETPSIAVSVTMDLDVQEVAGPSKGPTPRSRPVVKPSNKEKELMALLARRVQEPRDYCEDQLLTGRAS